MCRGKTSRLTTATAPVDLHTPPSTQSDTHNTTLVLSLLRFELLHTTKLIKPLSHNLKYHLFWKFLTYLVLSIFSLMSTILVMDKWFSPTLEPTIIKNKDFNISLFSKLCDNASK